jgi:3-phenylpropionate/cinnamic acid dioxygenase small subunit
MSSEIEQLLYHEAYLLDSGLFQEWLELLSSDMRYWAPVRAEVTREQEKLNEGKRLPLFNETKASLTLRISRIQTGLAWVENPPARTRRFISNIMFKPDDTAESLRVRSNFLLFKSRSFTDETIMVGSREDKWRRSDRWLLSERKILIDHCTVENMSLLL